MEMVMAYITMSDMAEAEKIGQNIVERRLAACVNVVGGMKSLYWWEGKIETSNEAILIAKTSKALVDGLIQAVKDTHSYDCPCVVVLPISGGNPDYLKWLESNITTGDAPE